MKAEQRIITRPHGPSWWHVELSESVTLGPYWSRGCQNFNRTVINSPRVNYREMQFALEEGLRVQFTLTQEPFHPPAFLIAHIRKLYMPTPVSNACVLLHMLPA